MSLLPTTAAGRVTGCVLTCFTAALVALFLAVFALTELGIGGLSDVWQFVHVGEERNLPTAWNGLLLLTVTIAAIIAGLRADPGPRRWSWLVIATATSYLTADELLRLHERLGAPVKRVAPDLPTYAWLIPGLVCAVAGSAILIMAARALPAEVARRLGGALACYAAGALGVEAVNGMLSDAWLDIHLLWVAGTAVEESLEMLACVLAITAIVDHLVGSHLVADNGTPSTLPQQAASRRRRADPLLHRFVRADHDHPRVLPGARQGTEHPAQRGPE